eukprot:UN19365
MDVLKGHRILQGEKLKKRRQSQSQYRCPVKCSVKKTLSFIKASS